MGKPTPTPILPPIISPEGEENGEGEGDDVDGAIDEALVADPDTETVSVMMEGVTGCAVAPMALATTSCRSVKRTV